MLFYADVPIISRGNLLSRSAGHVKHSDAPILLVLPRDCFRSLRCANVSVGSAAWQNLKKVPVAELLKCPRVTKRVTKRISDAHTSEKCRVTISEENFLEFLCWFIMPAVRGDGMRSTAFYLDDAHTCLKYRVTISEENFYAESSCRQCEAMGCDPLHFFLDDAHTCFKMPRNNFRREFLCWVIMPAVRGDGKRTCVSFIPTWQFFKEIHCIYRMMRTPV